MSDGTSVVNVVITPKCWRLWSRYDILEWINEAVKSNIQKVDHLCTGAAYCSLIDTLFPDVINMRKVKFTAYREKEFIENFEILEQCFHKTGIKKIIPIDKLVRGNFKDNYDFAIWFRLFYEANFREMPEDYDVEQRRFNQQIVKGEIPKLQRSLTNSTITTRALRRSRSQTMETLERRF